jgi:hypothetical protein
MAIRYGSRCFVTPQDAQKDRLEMKSICILDSKENRAEQQRPTEPPEYSQLSMQIFLVTGASAALFVHSINVAMATVLDGSKEFKVTDQKVIEGLLGLPIQQAACGTHH